MKPGRPSSAALRGSIESCDRCARVIDSITPDIYANALPGRYPVGSHLRHALEHVQCFVDGLKGGLVDYDARARDEMTERSLDCFVEKLAEARAALESLDGQDLSRPLRVRQTPSLDSAPQTYQSTVERELVFLSSHTIHHLAVVVHLCREHGVELGDDISMAFSTAAHHQALKG